MGRFPPPRRTLAVGAAAAAVLAVVAAGQWGRRPAAERPRADRVVLQALEGPGEVRLASFRGRPLVVNSFASWCPPCIEELPAFARVHRALDGRVSFLGVAFRDDPAAARRLAEASGVDFPLAADSDGRWMVALGVRGMPSTLFVDARGRVVGVHTGPLTGSQLRSRIARHFGIRQP